MTPHQSIIHLRIYFRSQKPQDHAKKGKEKHKLFITTTTTTMNHLTNPSFFEPRASDKMPPVSNSPLHTHTPFDSGILDFMLLISPSTKNFHKST
jgi:hypothetical protein